MASLSADINGARLSDYGNRLARKWWVVVIGVVIGLGISLGYAKVSATDYVSTSAVLVTSSDALDESTGAAHSSTINLDTEAQIVRSAAIAAQAAALLKTTESPAQLSKQVTVSVPPNSQVLSIAFRGGSPLKAQQGSHAFAQAYLDSRIAQVASQVKAQTTALTGQIADLSAQLKTVTGQIASLPSNSTERAYADAQKTILSSQIMTLNSQLAPLREASSPPGRILTDAPLPHQPASPSKAIVAIGGLMIGLLLGAALALGVGWADRRVRRVGDISSRLTVPILGTMSATKRRGGDAGPLGDDADRLRNAIQATTPDARIIQVASTSGLNGAHSTSVPLAASLAAVEGDALLVCLSPGSELAVTLGLDPNYGLSEVLEGRVPLADALQAVRAVPGLLVLTAGSDIGHVSRLLASGRGTEFFDDLRALDSYVICDSADPSTTALAQSLMRASDVTVLAVEAGVTDVRHLEAVATDIVRFGGHLAGVVLAPPAQRGWRPRLVPVPPDPTGPEVVDEVELDAGTGELTDATPVDPTDSTDQTDSTDSTDQTDEGDQTDAALQPVDVVEQVGEVEEVEVVPSRTAKADPVAPAAFGDDDDALVDSRR